MLLLLPDIFTRYAESTNFPPTNPSSARFSSQRKKETMTLLMLLMFAKEKRKYIYQTIIIVQKKGCDMLW